MAMQIPKTRSISLWNSSKNKHCPLNEDVTKEPLWGFPGGARKLIPPELRKPAGSYLVLPFQHQQICNFPKGKSQSDHFSLVYVIRQLADVDHTWWNTRSTDVTFEFFCVVAISCGWWGWRRQTKTDTIREGQNRRLWLILNNGLIVMETQTNQTGQAFPYNEFPLHGNTPLPGFMI